MKSKLINLLKNMTKKEIIHMAARRCKHGSSYMEHPNCFIKENGIKERLAFFDIETSNLAADYGVVICYCLKEHGNRRIYSSNITREDIATFINGKHRGKKNILDIDYKVVKQCVSDLMMFDKIVTFYGTRFDVPFIRTRAVSMGLDFPQFGELYHKDVFYTIKGKFRLHRNRQETSSRFLVGTTRKTHYDGHIWTKALLGHEPSIAFILDHCKRDVKDLEDLYDKVIGFTKNTNNPV